MLDVISNNKGDLLETSELLDNIKISNEIANSVREQIED